MPKRIQAEAFSVEHRDLTVAFDLCKNSPVPESPMIRAAILPILVDRLADLNSDTASGLKNVIHSLAALEKLHWWKLSITEREKPDDQQHFETLDARAAAKAIADPGFSYMIHVLKTSKFGKGFTHNPFVLAIQKVVLNDVFKTRKFPTESRIDKKREAWLKKHKPEILQRLRPYPCGCTYQKLEDIDNEFSLLCEDQAGCLYFLLAKFHATESQHIQKLLKPSNIKKVTGISQEILNLLLPS